MPRWSSKRRRCEQESFKCSTSTNWTPEPRERRLGGFWKRKCRPGKNSTKRLLSSSESPKETAISGDWITSYLMAALPLAKYNPELATPRSVAIRRTIFAIILGVFLVHYYSCCIPWLSNYAKILRNIRSILPSTLWHVCLIRTVTALRFLERFRERLQHGPISSRCNVP